MRLLDRPRHYRRTSLQQKLREGTCAVPGHRRCPHPPHRGHPGQRGVMACQPRPTAAYLVAEGISPTTGPGREGKEKTMWCLLSLRVHIVCAMKCGGGPAQPTYTTIPSLPYTSAHRQEITTVVLPNATLLHWAHSSPYSLSCGEQVPDVGIPHYRDTRMQHSQTRWKW